MKTRFINFICILVLFSVNLNAQKKKKRKKVDEQKTLQQMTEEEIQDSIDVINFDLQNLQSEIISLDNKRVELKTQLRRIAAQKTKDILNDSGLESDTELVLDSLKKVNGFKHMFMVTEVFDKKYEKSIKFLSDKFYCQSNDRALKKIWRRQYKSVIQNKEKIWETYNSIDDSKVDIYQYSSEKQFYQKFNQIKETNDDYTNTRVVNFSPNCESPQQILDNILAKQEELEIATTANAEQNSN